MADSLHTQNAKEMIMRLRMGIPGGTRLFGEVKDSSQSAQKSTLTNLTVEKDESKPQDINVAVSSVIEQKMGETQKHSIDDLYKFIDNFCS